VNNDPPIEQRKVPFEDRDDRCKKGFLPGGNGAAPKLNWEEVWKYTQTYH